MDVQYLTPDGYKELEARIRFLQVDRRAQVADRLRTAMEEGGELSENPEYEDAKNEQAFLEGEISRLEQILLSAKVIEAPTNHDIVQIGARVTVVEKGSKAKEVYHLVGSAEANPREGKISVESPLGKALLGAALNQQVAVDAPDGKITFVIKAIQ
jgi:transcription elongation factor GreA